MRKYGMSGGIITFLIAVYLMTPISIIAGETVFFEENFDNLELGANVDEALKGDNVWTDTPPKGWTIDDSGVPDNGVTEWHGWAFVDPAWWTQAAEGQRRSEFMLGENVVAVADPDEWDDKAHAGGEYNTFLSTPAIPMAQVTKPNSVILYFSSSWRPEDNQKANLTVSFDGGDPVEILRFESGGGKFFKDDNSTNDEMEIDIENPGGAKSMVLTWGMIEAGNDWWWAIDNISIVTTGPLAVSASRKLATCWGNVKRP